MEMVIIIRVEKERNKRFIRRHTYFLMLPWQNQGKKENTLPKYYWYSISHHVQNELLMNYNLSLKGKTKVLRRQQEDLRRSPRLAMRFNYETRDWSSY